MATERVLCPDCVGFGWVGEPVAPLTCDGCGGSGYRNDRIERDTDDEVADMVRDAFAATREQAEKERAGEHPEPGLMEFRCRDGED